MIVLLSLLAASVVAFVLFPVFASEPSGVVRTKDSGRRERQPLTEQKARLLEGIKDLEFDRDAGKISQSEFDASKEDYLSQIARILDSLDELDKKRTTKTVPGESGKSPAEPEADPADEVPSPAAATSAPAPAAASHCPACRHPNRDGAKFCSECGQPLTATTCAECGGEVGAAAKFCIHCGARRAEPATPATSDPGS